MSETANSTEQIRIVLSEMTDEYANTWLQEKAFKLREACLAYADTISPEDWEKTHSTFYAFDEAAIHRNIAPIVVIIHLELLYMYGTNQQRQEMTEVSIRYFQQFDLEKELFFLTKLSYLINGREDYRAFLRVETVRNERLKRAASNDLRKFEVQLAHSYAALGALYGKFDDTDNAITFYEYSANIMTRLIDAGNIKLKSNLAMICSFLALELMSSGEEFPAKSYCCKAAELCDDVDENTDEKAAVYHTIARIWLAYDEAEKALAFNQKSVACIEACAENSELFLTLMQSKQGICEALFDLGRYHECEICGKQLAKTLETHFIIEENRDPQFLSILETVYDIISETADAMGKSEDAEKFRKRSMEIAKALAED